MMLSLLSVVGAPPKSDVLSPLSPESLMAATTGPFTVPTNMRLANLLNAHSVTTVELANMCLQSYETPDLPADVNKWTGVVVNNRDVATGKPYYIPGALWEHNETGMRIMALQGLDAAPPYNMTSGEHVSATLPGDQVCLVANYECHNGNCQSDFEKVCREYGSSPPNGTTHNIKMSDVAAEVGQLLRKVGKIDMLTGHSLGCGVALSVARVLGLPIVCFGYSGSFSSAWVKGWPGLANATQAGHVGNSFVIQTYGDPFSNCLTPRFPDDSTRSWAAAACSYQGPQPGCFGPSTHTADVITFNARPFSACTVNTHIVPNYLVTPLSFDAGACADTCHDSVAVCPSGVPQPASDSCAGL